MPSAALAALRAYMLDNGGAAGGEFAEFVVAYFGNADPDELDARGSPILVAMAKAHVRLLDATDAPSLTRVRVFNPTLAEDGFTCDHTVVQIIHDDMPFLVDSVTMAVNRLGRMAHWIVHPLLIVERDVDHRIIRTASASSPGRQDARVLSFILVECDRIVSKDDRDRLAQELAQVLNDVRAAVADWPAMLQRLQVGAAVSDRSILSKEGQEEGVAFLSGYSGRA